MKVFIEFVDANNKRGKYKKKLHKFQEHGAEKLIYVNYYNYMKFYKVSLKFDDNMLIMNFQQCLDDNAQESWCDALQQGD